MRRTAQLGRALGGLAFVVACAAPARAQTRVLPPVPELKLQWPVAPLAFSYTGAELRGHAAGPLQLFRAESLWLRTPALQLLSIGSAERALELDCRLGCQPMVETAFSVEARLALPRFSPHIHEPHVFVRYSSLHTSQNPRAVGRVLSGLALKF